MSNKFLRFTGAILLIAFCIFPFMGFAGEKQENYYFYSPDGRVEIGMDPGKILIKFFGNVSFEQQKELMGREALLKPLTKEMQLPSPKVVVAQLTGNADKGKIIAMLQRLNQSNLVEYANPFLVYSDGTGHGIMDRFMVKLKSASDFAQLKQLVSQNGLSIDEQYRYDEKVYFIKVPKSTGKNALEFANIFHETGWFAASEPDFLKLLKRFNTNDTNLNAQWSLNNTGSSIQFNGTPGCDMKVFSAWGITTGSTSIKVAVIDEGVDLAHPDLLANLLPGYDGNGLGSAGGPSGNDAHGTACAGIIAGVGNNNLGVAGVAYSCKIIPVRIAYSDANGNWVTSNSIIGTSLDWAWQTGGADVLSNSWGGGSSSSLINDAITRAVTQGRGGLGAPVLFAAGNDNGAVSYPATLSNVISVTAMSMCNQRKSTTSCDGETFWGSNFGTNTDISAPGVKIYTCDISGSAGYSSGNYTATFNGTSSACPNAAGVMALILSANSSLTMANARQIIESTCDKVGGYTYNANVSGQPNGTWSNDLGYGRVNAFAALQLAAPVACTSPPPVATTNASPNNICVASSVSLSLTGITFGTGQTYQWQSSPNNSTWTNISGATSFSHSLTVSTATYYRCVVTCGGNSTNSASTLVTFNNSTISTFPHTQNFDASSSLPCGWLAQNVNGDGNTWNVATFNPRSGTNNVTYGYNASLAADDWLFTPGLSMIAGNTYRIRFWYRARSASFPERLEVKWGAAQNAAGMTSAAIFSNTNITNTTYTEGISGNIVPTTTGTYHIGFRVFSAADMYDLNVDDVTIELVSIACTVPTVGGTATITSPVVSGSTTTMTVSGYNGTSVQWEQSTNGGTTWTAISGATTPTYTGALPLGTYQIRARISRSGCVDAFSNVVNLTVNPLTGDNLNLPIQVSLPYTGSHSNTASSGYTNQFIGQASADIFFRFTTGSCTDSIVVSTCGSPFDTYLHLLNAAGTVITFNDDNGPSCVSTAASMRVAVSPNTVYYVVAEGYNANTGTFNLSISEIDSPFLTASITANGPTTFCQGGSVVLTSSAATGNTWSNGATTQSITVSNAGNYNVTVVNAAGCSATSSNTTVTVNPSPTPTISAGGSTTFCQGGSVVLTSSAATGNTWSNGATTQSITVSISGNYFVTVVNGNGCSAVSNSISVNVSPLPTPTISAGGSTTFCQGGSVVLTSSSATGNTWSNGATTQNITVTSAGTYQVTVVNGAGCSATSNSITINVNPSPTPTISAGGSTTLCTGETVVLTSSASSGNTWSNGATTQSITVSQAGTYSVTVNNGTCSGSSNSIAVTVQACSGPSTQIRTSDCGRTNFNLQSSIVADLVSGATQYEFQFRDAANVNIVATRIQTSRTLVISSVTPALQWGTNYNVRVRPIIGANPGSFGSACVIGFVPNPAIFGVPATQLNTTSCGKLNNILSSSTITANAVNGATQYEFEFRNVSTNALVATKIQTNNFTTLSSVTPALQWGTQYNVRVRAYYGTFAGTYSTVCLIGIIPDPAVTGVPNTQLSTASCGATNLALTGTITCVAVSGANQYEWEFRNPSNSALVATKTTTSTSLNLSTVSPALQWGTQYNVRVRAFISSTGGTFSTVCLISTMIDPAIGGVPSTRLNSMNCGNVNLTLSNSIVALTVSGASQYEFEFTNPSNGSVYATRTSTSATLFLSNVTPALQWGTQYNVRVRAYIGSTAGTYGNVCLIGIIPDPAVFGVPNTKLRTADCGKLNFALNSNMAADAVAGATQYEFEFRNPSNGNLVATRLQTSATLNAANVSPALQAGTQYNVRVRAHINTFVGNYGTICLIGFVSGAREGIAEEQSLLVDEVLNTEINLYPNPMTQNATLMVKSAISEQAELLVFDVAGKLVQQEVILTNTNVMVGDQLDFGTYIISVRTQGGEVINTRMMKQ